MAKTPEEIKPHEKDYNPKAWESYSISELGWFIHLLAKRAGHRSDPEKRAKDLYDARNYLRMLEAKLAEIEAKT